MARILMLAWLAVSPGVAVGQVCGDCNEDGILSVLDVLLAAQLDVGLEMSTPARDRFCDVDSSQTINTLDALRIAQETVGLAPPLVCNTGLLAIGDMQYVGAFRLSSATFGVSSTNYAVGALAYNPANHSLFIAGHAQHNAIAEFAIPTPSPSMDVFALPEVAAPLQPFVALLDSSPTGNPEGIDRVTGMLWFEGQLIINAEEWYDAPANNVDTTLVVRDANNLAGAVDGYFELQDRARVGGYMAAIPAEWQAAFGGDHLTGWSSVYSIISRYSIGPSLAVFDPRDITGSPPGAQGAVADTPFMNFDYGVGEFLDPSALQTQVGSASPLWNHLSSGVYGFIVPGTRTFAVFGASGGVDSGIGYKITQDTGTTCGGYCSYQAADNYSYYWFFDVEQILAAGQVYEPRPYAFDRWSPPFGNDPDHPIIGATFDPAGRDLYLALANAGQVGTYDRPPLILVYHIP